MKHERVMTVDWPESERLRSWQQSSLCPLAASDRVGPADGSKPELVLPMTNVGVAPDDSRCDAHRAIRSLNVDARGDSER